MYKTINETAVWKTWHRSKYLGNVVAKTDLRITSLVCKTLERVFSSLKYEDSI